MNEKTNLVPVGETGAVLANETQGEETAVGANR